MAKYVHPQGATIVVYDDGSLAKFDKNGKATKTSATAEKLAKGHGGWVLVDGEPTDFTVLHSDREAVPGGVVRIPMKFKSAHIDTLMKYENDDNYLMQQKIDGIRAQIVFKAGTAGCWVRSNSGTRLKSSTSAPVVLKIEKHYENTTSENSFTIDGEIINGTFWAFDLVTSEDINTLYRYAALKSWYLTEHIPPGVRVLPTAYTTEEKKALVDKVIANNGEGFIVKHVDAGYTWGGRVDHSLKIKLVDTVDCVVTAVNVKGKDNIALGLYDDSRTLVPVGQTSTIGKGVFAVGDTAEIQYLYAGSGGKLVQPTILRKRTDKAPQDCHVDQLKYVNKEVVA